ncbi:MAG: prepilin-type N-terminal cleavage/methylation domain-containing protein [Candidatus Omnitrophota bacterium]
MNKKHGFTLIEILIALLIFGLGVVILFNLFPLSFQAFSYSRKLQDVSLLAQKKFEELKSSRDLTEVQSSQKDGDLEWSIKIGPVDPGGDASLMLVELNIEFDFQGKTHSERFVTYLSNE